MRGEIFHDCQVLGNLESHFFFFRTSAGIKKNRKNRKNVNHNVLGGSRNARNERNDKKANALYFFIFFIFVSSLIIFIDSAETAAHLSYSLYS